MLHFELRGSAGGEAKARGFTSWVPTHCSVRPDDSRLTPFDRFRERMQQARHILRGRRRICGWHQVENLNLKLHDPGLDSLARCRLRSTTLEKAQQACERHSWCGGITRDNGLPCSDGASPAPVAAARPPRPGRETRASTRWERLSAERGAVMRQSADLNSAAPKPSVKKWLRADEPEPVPGWRRCQKPPEPRAVCKTCLANSHSFGHKKCDAHYSWKWDKSISEQASLNRVPGLRTVFGIAAANESDVRTVRTWRQSNWPALIMTGIATIEAATPADRLRLCSHWHNAQNSVGSRRGGGENGSYTSSSYTSWPLLLRCPGVRFREFEDICANRASVFALPCALVDYAQDNPEVSHASIYDGSRYYQLEQSRWPANPCMSERTKHVPEVAVTLSVYPTAVGHFVPELIPKLILLNASLPADTPILVPESEASRRYLKPLFDSRALDPRRIIFRTVSNKDRKATISADAVYALDSSHFSGPTQGDLTYKMARDAYSPNGSVALKLRRHVVLLQRGKGHARSVTNEEQLVHALERQVRRAADARARQLKVVTLKPGGSGTIDKDIAVMRHAALIVSPHGAGLGNLLFASARTAVIEICYDGIDKEGLRRGMQCPPMYGVMGVNLGLPYWVVTGRGTYGSPMDADLPQIEAAAAAALATVYNRTVRTNSFTSVAQCRARRMRRRLSEVASSERIT